MKYLILFLFLTAVVSCHKDNDPLSWLADGTIQYKVNATSVTVDNVGGISGQSINCNKEAGVIGFSPTQYNFSVQKNNTFLLFFDIITDSLNVGDYVIDTSNTRLSGASAVLSFNNIASSVFLASDNFQVHISSYVNGRISGTFSAEMSPNGALSNYNLHRTTKITDGEFKNIQCTY